MFKGLACTAMIATYAQAQWNWQDQNQVGVPAKLNSRYNNMIDASKRLDLNRLPGTLCGMNGCG